MKNLKYILIIFIMFVGMTVVNAAGGINVSTTSLTMNDGSTSTFNVVFNNAFGVVDVISDDPAVAKVDVSTFDEDSDFGGNKSKTITVTGVSVGKTKIKVKVRDGATYDDEEIIKTMEINVTVNSAAPAPTQPADPTPTEPTQPTQPSNPTPVDPTTTKATTTKVTTTKPVTTTTKPVDDPEIEVPKIKNQLSSLKIDGYNIRFSPDVYNYSINVLDDVKEINVEALALSDKFEIENAGTIDITNKDKVEIVLLNKETNEKVIYTINIRRSEESSDEEEDPVVAAPVDSNKKDDSNNILYIIIGALAFVVLVIVIAVLSKKGKAKEINKTVEPVIDNQNLVSNENTLENAVEDVTNNEVQKEVTEVDNFVSENIVNEVNDINKFSDEPVIADESKNELAIEELMLNNLDEESVFKASEPVEFNKNEEPVIDNMKYLDDDNSFEVKDFTLKDNKDARKSISTNYEDDEVIVTREGDDFDITMKIPVIRTEDALDDLKALQNELKK